MNKRIQNRLEQYIKAHRRRKVWLTVALIVCTLAAVGTTYVLVRPAATKVGQTYCGLEEHTEHSETCYQSTLTCICPLSEEGHVHTSDCYERVQICALEETEGHLHSEACYVTESVLVCGNEDPEHVHTELCYEMQDNLVCTLAEVQPHHHDDSCYTVNVICGMTESLPHQHTGECYRADRMLICDKPLHTHTLQCFSNPEADVEDAAMWEQALLSTQLSGNWQADVLAVAETQLGYNESAENFLVQEDGATVKGYTRYGAWYGCPYEDWDALFCSFCLNYAGVDRELMPQDMSCQSWIDSLSDPARALYHSYTAAGSEAEDGAASDASPEEAAYIPALGDLVFFDLDSADPARSESREADHVGFVTELIYDAETDEVVEIGTIEGDAGDTVCRKTYALTDPAILGYGELPMNPMLPENASEAAESSEELPELTESQPEGGEAAAETASEAEEMTEDPEASEAEIRTIESLPASDGAVAVISGHLPENAQAEILAVPLSEEELITYFGAEKAALMTGYVAYDIKITVDGEEWQPDDTVSVTVRQPELDLNDGGTLGLVHVEDDTNTMTDVDVLQETTGELSFETDGFSLYIFYVAFTVDFSYEGREYSMNGMESMLLGELFTELSIEADAADVQNVVFSDPSLLQIDTAEDGSWRLTSLQPFTTDETLTVVFSDGTELVIDVTDDVSTKTVTWDPDAKTATIQIDGKNSSTSSTKTIRLQYASGSTYTDAVSKSVSKSAQYTLIYQLPNNSSSINTYKNWRVSGDTTTSLGTIYQLLNLVPIDAAVKAKYSSSSFQNWLNNEYVNKSNYRKPSAPETMAELMTAFDYYYSGRIETPNVWCYHANQTTPYAKYYTLYEATRSNTGLRDGDILELHGDTTETKQTAIQKSITLRSDPEAPSPYTVNFVTTDGYYIYEAITCNKHADPNGPAVSEIVTRDCITVCPAVFGTELEVLFENVILDGFDAYHKEGDIHDYHLLQTIHDVELTLSGVTIQNYNIQSGLNSNGAVSLDGRTSYTAPSGSNPASYGNRIIMTNGSVLKNCNSYQGSPYSTAGFTVVDALLELSDATIKECESRNGPAIVILENSTVYLHSGTVIEDCLAQEQGGAIHNSGTLYIEDGSVMRNCAPQSGFTNLKGGAVFNNMGKVYVSGGTVENCSGNRGGMCFNFGGLMEITGGEISDCEVTGNGGGAIFNDSAASLGLTGIVDISGGLIENCYGAKGGAIYNNSSTVYISGGTMTDNTAGDDSKTYDVPATLGSAIYQNGMMYLSGAPVYAADQDVYLPVERVITKNGAITNTDKISVVLENEPRYRDILVSQAAADCTVSDSDLGKLEVKLSDSAMALSGNQYKALAAVYNANGLNNAVSGAVKNVVELDITDSLVVNKVWSGDTAGTTHDPITVYLYRDGVANPVDQLVLSEANGWRGRFTGIEVNSDGTLPYTVSEAVVSGYVSSVGAISYVRGEETTVWVPVSALSSGEFVLYGGGPVLSHTQGTLTTSSPSLTQQSLTLNGTTYSSYFTGDVIADNMVWLATDSSTVLTTKAIAGESQYKLYYSSSKISLSTSSSSQWKIDNKKLRQGSNSRYLNLGNTTSWYASSSSSATTITPYKKMTGPETPGYYTVTLTNVKIRQSAETPDLIDPQLHKQIDYLGDGQTNLDTNASGDDLYRLYLDMTSNAGPIDLLLIVDCSASMQWDCEGMCEYGFVQQGDEYVLAPITRRLASGGYDYAALEDQRKYVLDQIINGSGTVNTTYDSEDETPFRNAARAEDGLTYNFLSAHPENRIAVLAYANDTVVRQNWASKAEMPNHGATAKDCYINVVPSNQFYKVGDDNKAGTNYHLALMKAEEQLLRNNTSGHQKVVVFLTDGLPNKRVQLINGEYIKDQSTTDAGTAGSAALGFVQNTMLDRYPGMMFFTVGITTDNEAADNAPVDLLTNMAQVYGNNGECFMSYTEEDLKDSLFNVLDKIQLRPTLISDTLADYVDFADPMDLLITMKDPADTLNPNGSNEIPLWNALGEQDGNTINGSKLVRSVSISGKTIEVSFNDAAVPKDVKTFTVSYNVQRTGTPSEDDIMTGDEDTDYRTNNTSSGAQGFPANEGAYARFSLRQNLYQASFPHPVVQVYNKADIKLIKIDAEDTDTTLKNASFDLYKELSSQETGSTTYTDGSGTEHYLMKINTAALVSGTDGSVTVKEVELGRYYLFETEAPAGYAGLEQPVLFELQGNRIVTTDENTVLDSSEPLTLKIKNSSGYELPETGGPGTEVFTLSGLLLMAGAILYGCGKRRKYRQRA